jgi:uncharacterized protein YdaU (DUF1376 family)
MPLYIGDYLADTRRLTNTEHGCYLLLIMDYWKSGPIPDHDEILARITLCTPEQWKSVRLTLLEFFQIEAGRWRHKRIDLELTHATSIRASFSERAKAAAEARWSDRGNVKNVNKYASSIAPSIAPSIPSSNAQAMPSPSPSPSPVPVPVPTPSHHSGASLEEGGLGEGDEGALEFQKLIGEAFPGRGRWTCAEETLLVEVFRREGAFEEWPKILRFKQSVPSQTQQVEGVSTVRQILSHWTDILDKVNGSYDPSRLRGKAGENQARIQEMNRRAIQENERMGEGL